MFVTDSIVLGKSLQTSLAWAVMVNLEVREEKWPWRVFFHGTGNCAGTVFAFKCNRDQYRLLHGHPHIVQSHL